MKGSLIYTWFMGLLLLSTTATFIQAGPTNGSLSDAVKNFEIENSEGIFTENAGQWEEELSFISRTSFGHVGFGAGCVIYHIQTESPDIGHFLPENVYNTGPEMIDKTTNGVVIKLDLFSGREPEGRELIDYNTHFFVGGDDTNLAKIGSNFRSVLFEELWPSIDMRYYFMGSDLKYEIIVKTGGDPNDIRIQAEGCDSIVIDHGSIDFTLDGEVFLTDNIPTAFQSDGSQVDCSFKVMDDLTYGFSISGNHANMDLIIDPLVYSSYMGGLDLDVAYDQTTDLNENIILTGVTLSFDFPTTPGAYENVLQGIDIFIMKMDSMGSKIISCTLITGDDWDYSKIVRTDESGNIYIAGDTYSSDYPTTDGAFNRTHWGDEWDRDIIVTKLDPDCTSLIFSTYIAGENDDLGNDMELDGSNNVIVAGLTISDEFPISDDALDKNCDGYTDSYLLNLDSSGSSLIYSTYFGGDDIDNCLAVEMIDDNHAIIAGFGYSTDLPISTDAYQSNLSGEEDGYLCIIDLANSTIDACTYFGSFDNDEIMDLCIGDDGSIIVGGITASRNLPGSAGTVSSEYKGGDYDSFIMKINGNLSALIFSTYIGGSYGDLGYSISTGMNGSIAISGLTYSTDLETTENALSTSYLGGGQDGFFTLVDSEGTSIIYSTYIGGEGDDYIFFGKRRSNSSYYLGGATDSTDLQTTDGCISSSYIGNFDIFLMLLDTAEIPSPPRNLTSTSGGDFIHLSWDLPLFEGGSPIIEYRVYRMEDAEKVMISSTDASIRNYNDTDVESGTGYSYWIRALNNEGESSSSNVVVTSTLSRPSPPVGLSGVVGPKNVTLTWSLPLITGGEKIKHYNIFRSNSSSDHYQIATVGDSSRAFIDRDIIPGDELIYFLTAENSIGTSDRSNEITVSTFPLPDPPGSLKISCGDSFILLSWMKPASNSIYQVNGFKIYRGLDEGSLELIESLSHVNERFNDTNVENGITYYYSVHTVSQVGESIDRSTLSATPGGVPDAPSGLEYIAGNRWINISWMPPLSNNGFELEHYLIHRATGVEELEIGSVSPSTHWFNDTEISSGIEYIYKVRAVNKIGNSLPGIIRIPKIKFEPSPPRDLITSTGYDHAFLAWRTPEFENGAPVRGYKIYRLELDEEPREIGGSKLEQYNDTTVLEGGSYVYLITAFNSEGESDPLRGEQLLIPKRPSIPSNLTIRSVKDGILLNWNAGVEDIGSEGENKVLRIYRYYPGTNEFMILDTITPSRNEYLDTTVSLGQDYEYYLTSFNSVGESDPSEMVSLFYVIRSSSPVNVSLEIIDGSVSVSWELPVSNGGSQIIGYSIYRSETGKESKLIGEVSSSAMEFMDISVDKGHEYHYSVYAETSFGISDPSDSVSIDIEGDTKVKGDLPLLMIVSIVLSFLILGVVVTLILLRNRNNNPDQAPETPSEENGEEKNPSTTQRRE